MIRRQEKSPRTGRRRALLLNANLKGVGTYLRAFYFGREIARSGYEVTLCTVSQTSALRSKIYYKKSWVGSSPIPDGPGPWVRIIEGPRVGYKWLPGWGSGPLDILLRTKEIAFGDYDVVYGFEYHPNVSWPVYLLRGMKRFRFYSDWCDWHSGNSNHFQGKAWAHKVDAFLEERIRFRARVVSVISDALKERAITIGIPEASVVKIAEGVDTEYISHMEQPDARDALALERSARFIVCVSDGDMVRTSRILIEVLKKYLDAKAILIGRLAAEVKAEIKTSGFGDRFLLPGWVSDEDYAKYLSSADVCFLPLSASMDNRARFPAKMLDFLAAGRPVCTNLVGEVGQLIHDHHLGLAVESGFGEEEGLAISLERLLSDHELRVACGQRARELMVQKWDWRHRTEIIVGLVNT